MAAPSGQGSGSKASRWPRTAGVLRWGTLAGVALAGCGGAPPGAAAPAALPAASSATEVPPGTASTVTTVPDSDVTTSTQPADPGATTAVLPPPIPPTGTLLMAPVDPLTIPAEPDCHQLLTQPAQIASISACSTASGPQGTVTGTDEGYAHTQEWDVWRRSGSSADEALTYRGNYQSTPGFVFHGVSTAGDGQMDLLAVEHAPGAPPVSGLDIIDLSGVVLSHVAVGPGGVVGPDPAGGIDVWSQATGATAKIEVLRYEAGQWRVAGRATVPAASVPHPPDDDGFGGGLP